MRTEIWFLLRAAELLRKVSPVLSRTALSRQATTVSPSSSRSIPSTRPILRLSMTTISLSRSSATDTATSPARVCTSTMSPRPYACSLQVWLLQSSLSSRVFPVPVKLHFLTRSVSSSRWILLSLRYSLRGVTVPSSSDTSTNSPRTSTRPKSSSVYILLTIITTSISSFSMR